jgi:hypothetical protein
MAAVTGLHLQDDTVDERGHISSLGLGSGSAETLLDAKRPVGPSVRRAAVDDF